MSNHRDTVLAYYEALATWDIPRTLAYLHPEVEFRAAANFIYSRPEPYVGPAAVEKLAQRLLGEWHGFKVLPEEIQGAGDLVIARGRYIGTYKATGFWLDAEFVHVFKFKDGKIILQHNYTDTAQFRDAVLQSRAAPAMSEAASGGSPQPGAHTDAPDQPSAHPPGAK